MLLHNSRGFSFYVVSVRGAPWSTVLIQGTEPVIPDTERHCCPACDALRTFISSQNFISSGVEISMSGEYFHHSSLMKPGKIPHSVHMLEQKCD